MNRLVCVALASLMLVFTVACSGAPEAPDPVPSSMPSAPTSLPSKPTSQPLTPAKPGHEAGAPLVPVAVCTKMGCPSSEPCCNSCRLEGWEVNGLDVDAGDVKMPKCKVDGCGKCAKTYKAWGTFKGSRFVLERWEAE